MAETLTASSVAPRATGATLLGAALPRVLAALLLAAAGLGAWQYPFAQIPLALGLLAYAALGLWRPPLLLVMLPLWLTLVNLAPWSGSLYLEDYDLMLAVTLAVLMGRGLYATRIRLTHWQWVFLGLLVTSYTVSMLRGLLPLPEWNPAELSTYYSRWHALRLGKGFFWALLLLPGLVALLRYNHVQARLYLAWGLALSGLAIGGVAMWERGVLEVLFSGDGPYAVAKSLLDFTSRYRITGLFSEMHTGGEAIDGFVALIWPFAIIAAVGSRSRWGVALGTLCLLGVLYAGVSTFSRVTYAALLIGAATAGMLWMLVRGDRVGEKRLGRFEWSALLGLPVPLLMPYLFTQGGVPTLGAGLLCWAASYALGALGARTSGGAARKRLALLAAVLAGGVFAGLMAHFMETSKWVSNEAAEAWLTAAGFALAGVAGGFWSGARMPRIVPMGESLMLAALLAAGVGVVTPAALGAYMSERTETNAEDFGTRLDHWNKAIDLVKPDALTQVFGMGTGRFPETYLWAGHAAGMGTYRFEPQAAGAKPSGEKNGGYFLKLGGGQDAAMMQRISLPAYQPFTLSMDVRTSDPKVWLRVRFYRRNIILLSEWPGQNLTFNQHVTDTKGEWRRLTWQFNAGPLGDDGSLGRRPLVLELMNWRKYDFMLKEGTLLDIDNLSLKDAAGHELLANGDFDRGMERWFPHYDFNHLPWHVKNLWVNLYFDQGLLGVFAFSGFVAVSFAAALRRARDADLWGIGVSASVASYLTVGMFGGMLDMPRIIFICWLLLFITALTGPVRAVRR